MLYDKKYVKFIRWPIDKDVRSYCKNQGVPRLLIVEAGMEPPICSDTHEDWVRPPISQPDLDARVEALRIRAHGSHVPRLDSVGALSFGGQLVTLSSTQNKLMEIFIERFKEVVTRSDLEQCLNEYSSASSRNSLDLHIMRLRRRIGDANLAIRTAWGKGYLLEPGRRS